MSENEIVDSLLSELEFSLVLMWGKKIVESLAPALLLVMALLVNV